MNNLKYMHIYYQLRNELATGTYKSGEFLPSEHNLMDLYQVSRDTIRKSLNLLEQDFLIRPVKRKGYVCLDNQFVNQIVNQDNLLVNNCLQNIAHQNDHEILEFELKVVDQITCQTTSFDLNDNYYYAKRITRSQTQPIILDIIHINTKYVPEITKAICEKSIYKYLEQHGISTKYKRRIFKTRLASDDEINILNLKQGELIIEATTFTFADDGRIFEYTISIFNPHTFLYVE